MEEWYSKRQLGKKMRLVAETGSTGNSNYIKLLLLASIANLDVSQTDGGGLSSLAIFFICFALIQTAGTQTHMLI